MGTYALLPGPSHQPTNAPTLLAPAAVQEYLIYQELTPGTYPNPGVSDAQLIIDIRAYISNYKISSVVVDLSVPAVPKVSSVMGIFKRALGTPRLTGGVALWSGLRR